MKILDLRTRCKRCKKLPRGKIQETNFKLYAPFCSYHCQEWNKLEDAQRYIDEKFYQDAAICPTCTARYTKALYDWQYIYCHLCETYFEKHTGKLIKRQGDPQSLPKKYWKTDNELGN